MELEKLKKKDEVKNKIVDLSRIDQEIQQQKLRDFDTKLQRNWQLPPDDLEILNSPKIASRSFLLHVFKQLATNSGHQPHFKIGLVGFPNVGKSSFINKMTQEKKAKAGKTPGKTKIVQYIGLGDGLTLCDCPGLILPQIVHSKSKMVVNGITNVDFLTGFVEPVKEILRSVPSFFLVLYY